LSKTKFLILDCLELHKNKWGVKIEDQFKKKDEFASELRKGSEYSNSRKSSINPTNVEYLRRSRFNSRADELINNPDMFNELVTSLGADITFYQCFKLTDDEFIIIKSIHKEMFNYLNNKDELSRLFNNLLEEVLCEKFIAVGHILENMFSFDVKNANKTFDLFLQLYDLNTIDNEDIKHGYLFFNFSIVLGLVNFKDNMIDYPNSKTYLKRFLNLIAQKNIIDEKLLIVYEHCCDNIEKFVF